MTATIEFNAAFLVTPRKGKAPVAPKQPRASVHADRKARRLALAYLIERLIEEGKLKGYAEAAARLGLTRARLTQVMDMLLLPTDAQEQLLPRSSALPARDLLADADPRKAASSNGEGKAGDADRAPELRDLD